MKEERPWGHYEVLSETYGIKVKNLWIAKDHRISLQSHQRRTEYWTVAEGLGELELDDAVFAMYPGAMFAIAPETRHRAKATSDSGMTIVEVQLGKYLEEDDIVRYEDDYKRT